MSNKVLEDFESLIKSIIAIPEENLTPEVIRTINSNYDVSISPKVKEDSIQSLIDVLNNEKYLEGQAANAIHGAEEELRQYVETLHLSDPHRQIVQHIVDSLIELFEQANMRYQKIDFVMNLTLDDNARAPKYAHKSDAAADLYAAETITLQPHSTSNLIKTGVHIQLPEGWMAMIVPRSSIGMKTGLRLSNSVGIIDNAYIGELGVIYDNISDTEYTIHEGDRIAQLLVFPSYHFQANIVETLEPTERGEGGYGSTGK